MVDIFEINLLEIQPSQLYISKKKLTKIRKKLASEDIESIDVIPIKKLDGEIIFTDGHTRAFLAYTLGKRTITVEWESEKLDWEMYRICVDWCKSEKIFTIADLENRIINHKDYEKLWYERCRVMQEKVIAKRKKRK